MEHLTSERLNFWNNRAELGLAAGSNDINVKALEIEAINSLMPENGLILDAGCGNGYTIVNIAKRRKYVQMIGFDYSPKMVAESNKLIKSKGLHTRVSVIEGNLANINNNDIGNKKFDCIYTQRSLINLDSFNGQLVAIQQLWKLVKPGGTLVLCEAFQDGLDEINSHRSYAGLEKITQPWHNTYLRLKNLEEISKLLGSSHKIIEFSGTYYFVSRVIHAWQSEQQKTHPSYLDPTNLMALKLPAIDACGQSKIAMFTKAA